LTTFITPSITITNTPRKHPLITPFELQMVGVSHENWGLYPLGVWINHWVGLYGYG